VGDDLAYHGWVTSIWRLFGTSTRQTRTAGIAIVSRTGEWARYNAVWPIVGSVQDTSGLPCGSGGRKESRCTNLRDAHDRRRAAADYHAPLGVEHFGWRPEGFFIAFVSPDESPNKAEMKSTITCLKWETAVISLPPSPLLRTSGWSLPQVARRSAHLRRVEPVEGLGGFPALLAAFLVDGRKADRFHSSGRPAPWR
jgi:hypothetical protein